MYGKIFILNALFLIWSGLLQLSAGYCNCPQDTVKKIDNPKKPVSKGTPAGTLSPAKGPTNPDEAKARQLFASASRKSQEGDFKGAIEDFTKSLALYKNGNTYKKRGLTYVAMDNYPLALEDYNEAIKMVPSDAKAYLLRGICFYEMKDMDKAEADLLKNVEIDSLSVDGFNYLAAIKFIENDFNGALENYSKVIKLDSVNEKAYTNRGMIRDYLKDFQGAVEDYDKALKLNPYNPTAYNNRGAAKIQLKDYASAMLDFDAALKLKDDYADAYGNRGRARFNTGDKTGACEDWQKAYALGLESALEVITNNCQK